MNKLSSHAWFWLHTWDRVPFSGESKEKSPGLVENGREASLTLVTVVTLVRNIM